MTSRKKHGLQVGNMPVTHPQAPSLKREEEFKSIYFAIIPLSFEERR
jgi:hypothetical protein